MPSTTFTATAPDGTLFTRTSASRTYVSAIISRADYANALAQIARDRVHYVNVGAYAAKAGGRYLEQAAERSGLDPAALTAESYADAIVAKGVSAVEAEHQGGTRHVWGCHGWAGRPDLVPAAIAAAQKIRGSLDVQAVPAVVA